MVGKAVRVKSWVRGRKWEGGYVRQRPDGSEQTYVIERVVDGWRFHKSTGAGDYGAALKHLARFEANPSRYSAAGDQGGPVRLTTELIKAFAEHQLGKGLTKEWIDEVWRCLDDWADVLGTKDLRHLDLHRDLKAALAGWPTRRPHRIKALKAFTRWLREELGLLRHADDATIDLKVPQAQPEKWKRRKVVTPQAAVKVLNVLPQPTKDIFHLLSATAWHLSEARRFALDGEIVRVNEGGVLAVLVTRHKNGELTRTPVKYPEHLEVAMRLRGLKAFPKRITTARHMRKACAAAGVDAFGLGVMRHSVLSWAHDLGADAQATSDFAQHKSKATTKRHYLDLAVPSADVPILRLMLP